MYGYVFTYMCVCMDACIQLANVLSLLLARGASTTGHRAAHTVHVCTRPYLHAHLVHPLVRMHCVCGAGINDCEAKLARVPMARVWKSLLTLPGETGACEYESM